MSVLEWADELQDFIDTKDWHGAHEAPGDVIRCIEAKADVMRAIKKLRSFGEVNN